TLVTAAPANVETITNTASLYAPTHTAVQALWATEVVSEGVILRVDKTGSADPVKRGDPLIYTLTYQNTGNVDATGVILTDTLPTDVIAVGAYPSPTTTIGQQWVWQFPLDAGVTETILITTTVGPDASVALLNHVDISAPGAWGDSDDLNTTVEQGNIIYLPLVMRAYTS
ncbi:MAG: hypothetical protein ACK2UQ_15525, partial [Anaerolineae bacterium]